MDVDHHLRSISDYYCVDEQDRVEALLAVLDVSSAQLEVASAEARRLISGLTQAPASSLVQQLLNEFSLGTEEGQALMVLAESLLRIPDRAVAESMISHQLERGNWEGHKQAENPMFVQASATLLELSGHLLAGSGSGAQGAVLARLLKSFSAPVIHRALMKMIRVMAGQFVFASDIERALTRARKEQDDQRLFSFDMLGEAAVCDRQSKDFYQSYLRAIECAGRAGISDVNISIKLSALSPRFEYLQQSCITDELVAQVSSLAEVAAGTGVGITIDAEEADKLELTLQVFAKLFRKWGKPFDGRLGLAVQAYSTRAMPVLEFLKALSSSQGERMTVRLVKGAYWDTEIKQAQVRGLSHYPVFTRKVHTDLSYLACAHFLMDHPDAFYPAFATHNPVTISHLLEMFSGEQSFEFQRLFGMGESLYDAVLEENPQIRCRAYCPVGKFEQLLPYLVRRILENGANDSVVRQLAEKHPDADVLSRHPIAIYYSREDRESTLSLPPQLFGEERENSPSVNLACWRERETLLTRLSADRQCYWCLSPVVARPMTAGDIVKVSNPATGEAVGECGFVTSVMVSGALEDAADAFSQWRQTVPEKRASLLDTFADQLVENRDELIALLVYEAGKTLQDAIDEVREAIDFARYYSAQCRQQFGEAELLPGPEGERNTLQWQGRGVFLCISPWNFPLAIFVGQVAAALAAGNCVLAKPAEDTPLIACRVVELMLVAGFEPDVVQCLPGSGAEVARVLLPDFRLAGVAFTGSTATAKQINRQLAAREGAIVPFVAETGGQNAMIVDSSALPEQVVKDVLHSAFFSAGQRCSALRVLFLQREISETVIELLKGAMATLRIGDPARLSTDVGPVINRQAAMRLHQHIETMRDRGRVLYHTPLPADLDPGRFIPPHLLRLDSMDELEEEHFGPVLHIVSYRYSQIDEVVRQIHRSGFGLTVGIQSRDQAFCQRLAEQLAVGNVYINRTMTGAVVGVQPFGGMGLSGTGPKAGGPSYLQRFAVEKTISDNVAAIGGNVNLLVQDK